MIGSVTQSSSSLSDFGRSSQRKEKLMEGIKTNQHLPGLLSKARSRATKEHCNFILKQTTTETGSCSDDQ